MKAPLRLQWGAPINHVYAFVAPTPANVDFLMGCDVMDAFGRGTTIDRGATRVVFPSERLSVPLETIQGNLSRVNSAPQRVLTTCSGCNFVYCTMRNLGYSIKEWHSIDIDPACRAVTAQIVPEAQLFEPCHDVSRLPPKLGKTHFDLHVSTNPCKSFSGLQNKPHGFRDTANADPSKLSAALHAYVEFLSLFNLIYYQCNIARSSFARRCRARLNNKHRSRQCFPYAWGIAFL